MKENSRCVQLVKKKNQERDNNALFNMDSGNWRCARARYHGKMCKRWLLSLRYSIERRRPSSRRYNLPPHLPLHTFLLVGVLAFTQASSVDSSGFVPGISKKDITGAAENAEEGEYMFIII